MWRRNSPEFAADRVLRQEQLVMQAVLNQVNRNECTASVSCEPPPLDLEQLRRRCMGRLDLVEKLLASFERRFPVELAEIQNCLAAGDVPRLVQLTHQLKGASGNIAAPRIHALMQTMEQQARADNPAAVADLFAQLQCEWEKFTEYRGSACLS